jgi:glycosyltransferase involved in cell wall biosynthesis
MAEALACGTPVVARRRGAVPEVVTDGVTGLIGETDDDLARLCGRLDQIDRATCRREAVRRFSPLAMVDGYEAIYRDVAKAQRGPVPEDVLVVDFPLLDGTETQIRF